MISVREDNELLALRGAVSYPRRRTVGDSFGFSLHVGDFDADGFFDLAIGVPEESVVTDFDQAGGVNVLYGAAGA